MSSDLMTDDDRWAAVLRRDRALDGRFVTGVLTTGIYCRPVCPAPSPKRSNVNFFPNAAAATAAGYRPCLRCRPELSPDAFARVREDAVRRALALIAEGALQDEGVAALAARNDYAKALAAWQASFPSASLERTTP